jgi:hypothetical protein
MVAMAFLAVATVNERDNTPTPRVLIPFTVNEIRQTCSRQNRNPRQHLGMVTLATKAPSNRPACITISAGQSASDPDLQL